MTLGLIVEEGRNQLYGLVEKTGRPLWKIYHICCPYFFEAKDGWFLVVCTSKNLMPSLGSLRE